MTERLTLMAVHAHPDDEASSTGGVLARYAAEGVRTVVVTCTDGEYGDATGGIKPGQPDHDPEVVRKMRLLELEAAIAVLGVHHHERLGYHDSGMRDWTFKDRTDVFCNVPLSEGAGRVAELFETYRPQVVVTYDENGGYGHPDHIRTHEVTMAAFAANPVPSKLYFTARRRSDMERIRRVLEERGIDVPARGGGGAQQAIDPARQAAIAEREARITTSVDIGAFADRKRAALAAHSSQADNIWWLRFPPDVMDVVFAHETFIRMHDTTGAPVPEADLFAGLR
jgi:LmbE family N-acetylglucosaminyl deacetylase